MIDPASDSVAGDSKISLGAAAGAPKATAVKSAMAR